MTARRPATLPRPDTPTQPDAGERPRTRRRFLVLVVAAALVAALGWVLTTRTWTTTEPPAGDGTTVSADDGTQASSGTAGDVTWRDFAGISLPVSATSGPHCTDGGRTSCFAHTNAGAAVAAVHLLVHTFPFAGSNVFGPTISDQIVGPDAPLFARLTADAYRQVAPAAGIPDGAPVPSEGGWVAGYRLDQTFAQGAQQQSSSDAGNEATPGTDPHVVRVLIRQTDSDGQTGFTEYTVRLVWRGSDWALVAPTWGDWRNAARALPAADRSDYLTYDTLGRA